MKTLKVTIILKVSDDIDPEDIKIQEHDVIDGFELTREPYDDDITSDFKIKSGFIQSVTEITKKQ